MQKERPCGKKKTFVPLLANRCAILCTGFIVWGTNIKPYSYYLVHSKEKKPFLLAGLYSLSEKDKCKSLVIISRSSAFVPSFVHPRIPVILGSQKDVDHWLEQQNSVDEAMPVLDKQYSNTLEWYEIGGYWLQNLDIPVCIQHIKLKITTNNKHKAGNDNKRQNPNPAEGLPLKKKKKRNIKNTGG